MITLSKLSDIIPRRAWFFDFATGKAAYGDYTRIDWEVTLFGVTYTKFH